MFLLESDLPSTGVWSLSGPPHGIQRYLLSSLVLPSETLCCLSTLWVVIFWFKFQESLPPEYARIFTFDNFARTQKHVISKAQEKEHGDKDECIPASSYVRLHIKEVPLSVASRLCDRSKISPVIACGLLQHESKISVLHFRYKLILSSYFLVWPFFLCSHNCNALHLYSVKKHETYSAPIKAKEELIFHVGFRQFVTR